MFLEIVVCFLCHMDGPNAPIVGLDHETRALFDRDLDHDIDLADFAWFQNHTPSGGLDE